MDLSGRYCGGAENSYTNLGVRCEMTLTQSGDTLRGTYRFEEMGDASIPFALPTLDGVVTGEIRTEGDWSVVLHIVDTRYVGRLRPNGDLEVSRDAELSVAQAVLRRQSA